jgi:leucyl aminopeptidase
VKVEIRQSELTGTDAALVVVGLYEDESAPDEIAAAPGAEAATGKFKTLSPVFPADGPPALVAGLGKREDAGAERLRVLAAVVAKEAGRREVFSLAWALPELAGEDEVSAEALVTGTILGAYNFDQFRGKDADEKPGLETLILLASDGVAAAAETARVIAEAQNRARDLQATPANFATPAFLAGRAEEIAAGSEKLSVEVLDRAAIVAKGMGGLAAVGQGGPEEPRLIVLRYDGGGDGDRLGLIGKGVTFDTGGISLKPGAGMAEMKFDMSGGAAVLETVAAVAELDLELDLIAVVPATENVPSGTAIKPGDVITQFDGKTVEVNNTDAEGRLILADALAYAIEQGADRVVDIATLTGAVVIALGSTYAAVISNDDALAAELAEASEATGELTWRLPLHDEFREMMKGTVADLSNLASKREAGTITAAAFLEHFVGETPWAHVDIAGTGWDTGREYAAKGGSGYGVRLLTELARRHAA